MASSSGPTIVAKFVADTSKLTSEVDKVGSSAGSSLESFGKKAALAVGGAFAISKVVEFGKASVEAAAADAEAQTKLATTLRNVTGATDAQVAASESFITKLSKQTALADDDLRPAMDNLVRGFGNAEEAQKALALATDISAGTGKDLGTVSQALMKAAMGQTGALKKLGVETENADGSAKSLDQIMGDLSATFKGQAAGAADTTAGRMRNASIQFGEFQEQLGTAVLPLLSSLAGILTNTVLPVLQTLATFVSNNIAWIGPLAGVILAVVVALKAWSIAQAALNLVMSANPILLVVVAIAALVAGIIWAYNNVEIFRDIVQAAFKAVSVAFGWITDAASAVFDWLKSNWPLLLAILTGPIGAAVLVIKNNWDTIKDAATAVWSWVTDKWNAIVGGISSAASSIAGFMGNVVDAIRRPISAATEVYDWVKSKFEAIASAIGNVVGTITDSIGRVVSAIKAPINALIGGWNSLEFKVPNISLPKVDLGPLGSFGGQSFGGWTFGFPNIPTLAAGGILDVPTLFLGGEAGREIVAPEALLRSIMREEAGGNYTLNLYPRTADAADIAYGFRRLELMAAGR